MWVDYDGTVLQQESYLNNSRLTFTRVKDSRAKEFHQASIELRKRRLRDFDAVEFDPTTVPEDKVDVFSVSGTENSKEDNTRRGNGRHYRGQHGLWRDGYHRRREGDIWEEVEGLAKPYSAEDSAAPIVDPLSCPTSNVSKPRRS